MNKDILSKDIFFEDSNLNLGKTKIDRKKDYLEKQKMDTFKTTHPYAVANELCYTGNFLYHGIRFENKLEILEKIFRDKKIKAGKYIENYSPNDDNCNGGEYVSLIDYPRDSDLEYNIFIKDNISLIVFPECDAYKTIYVPYELWLKLKEYHNLKNRYSYFKNEYQIKEWIPLESVKAIGIPYKSFIRTGRKEEVEYYKSEIIKLMEKYDINLSIVDTSFFNDVLHEKEKNKVFRKENKNE